MNEAAPLMVVARKSDGRFACWTRPDQVRGHSASELWIFGDRKTDKDNALWLALTPIAAGLPGRKIHRLPSNERAED